MEFKIISKLFSDLEKQKKRIQKILILRDFYFKYPKDSVFIFDIISGTFQRDIDKKDLNISLKSLLQVLNLVSGRNLSDLEKEFNKIGDIGEIFERNLSIKRQKVLFESKQILDLDSIVASLKKIKKITGKDSNKLKIEILSNLFYLISPLDAKFLARFLLDDLRIGVFEGVLKEAFFNSKCNLILNQHFICNKCSYINLNLDNCFSCGAILDKKKQREIFENKNFNIKNLDTFNKYDSKILFRKQKDTILSFKDFREIYIGGFSLIEEAYNIVNSFVKLNNRMDLDINFLFNPKIILFEPIKSMLGVRVKNFDCGIELVGLPTFADFKYDGIRLQIHNKKGEVFLFTRNLEDITKQFPEVVKFIKLNFADLNFILDTECIGFDFKKNKFITFQELSRRILTKNLNLTKHITISVKVFDCLFFGNSSLIKQSYKQRRDVVDKLFIDRDLIFDEDMSFNLEFIDKSILQ